jgi:integrase
MNNPALAVPVAKMAATFHKVGERTLTEKELRFYLIRLELIPALMQRLALELQILTGGQRIEQLLRLTHSDINGEKFTLFDPKGKRVQPRVHTLPLLPEITACIGLLKELSPIAVGNANGSLFSSTGGSILNATTLSKLVNGISVSMLDSKESLLPFRGGDIRRTCETIMAGELGISKDTRAQLLSHGISGIQDVVYDKANYLSSKTTALRAWIDYLGVVRKGT